MPTVRDGLKRPSFPMKRGCMRFVATTPHGQGIVAARAVTTRGSELIICKVRAEGAGEPEAGLAGVPGLEGLRTWPKKRSEWENQRPSCLRLASRFFSREAWNLFLIVAAVSVPPSGWSICTNGAK